MSERVPASMRTRQSLSDPIEGRLSSADGRAELVKLAMRLSSRREAEATLRRRQVSEEALEAESRDALGRAYHAHGGAPRQG